MRDILQAFFYLFFLFIQINNLSFDIVQTTNILQIVIKN